jgi:hypothetical protein
MLPRSSIPNPGVEKAVVLAPIRVDAGLSSCPASPVTAKRVDYQPLLHMDYNDELDHLPTQFSDMLEARYYVEAMQFQSIPLIVDVWKAKLGVLSGQSSGVTAHLYTEF